MEPERRGLEMLAKARAAFGPDPFEELLKAGDAVPADWRGRSPEGGFLFLRGRLRFTQDELSAKSGLHQSLISRIEGGGDALLSTWRRLYAAMGFDLLLFPVSGSTVEELERRAEAGRPPDHWRRERARPRRRASAR